jgi:hypothetical protein
VIVLFVADRVVVAVQESGYQERRVESSVGLVVFGDQKIRRVWFRDEWHYALVDIVGVLTSSINATDYLKKLRKRDSQLGSYIGTNCPQVESACGIDNNRKE